MKRIIMLTMALAMMLVSLGGCYWGYEGRDRGEGYGRGGGRDERGEGRDRDGGRDQGERHDRGGERGGDHEERH